MWSDALTCHPVQECHNLCSYSLYHSHCNRLDPSCSKDLAMIASTSGRSNVPPCVFLCPWHRMHLGRGCKRTKPKLLLPAPPRTIANTQGAKDRSPQMARRTLSNVGWKASQHFECRCVTNLCSVHAGVKSKSARGFIDCQTVQNKQFQNVQKKPNTTPHSR